MKRFLKWVAIAFLVSVAIFYLWPEKPYKPFKVSPEYQAQADAFHVPEMPPDWKWQAFNTEDGTRLRWGETGNRNAAKASIIWIPGYTATLDMYGEHYDRLARRGYHVIGLDLRGQGGSERHRSEFPEKLWVNDFSVYSNDISAWLSSLELLANRPVILSGISFGGHVAARVLGEIDNLPVDGGYLMVPAFRPQTGDYSPDQAMRMMKGFMVFGKGERYVMGQGDWKPESDDLTTISECSSNAKRLHYRDVVFTRKPEQRVGGITNKWFYEFLESSHHINNQSFLSRIDVPVVVVSAETDVFVHNADNHKACADYISDCQEVLIPNTGHCLPQESDAVVEQLMDEFDNLLERISPSQN